VAIDPIALGHRITELRELRGLSVSALADAADDLAKSYLAKLERGEVENPGLRTLSAIARALDVTVADLLKPAESAGGASGKALLARHADLQRLTRDLPPGLSEFLAQMKAEKQAVPAATVAALARVEFRGKRPRTAADWRFLYDALERSVKS
jgi:transcriptional regulator with XRE-family HTH domain